MAQNVNEEVVRLILEGREQVAQEMLRLQQNVAASVDLIVKELQKAQSELGNLGSGFDAPVQGAETLGVKTIALGTILGNFATRVLTTVWEGLQRIGEGFLDAGRYAIDAAADFEKTRTAFTAMLGGASIADGFLQQVQDFARTVPFATSEIEQLARQMLGMGFAIGDILPNMRMLLDVAAGTDAPLSRIVFNYAQILAQNQAYTLDLKQFAQAGIPIYEELSKVLGVSVEEVRNLVKESKVGFEEVRAAFESMTSEGGRFYGITEQLSKTMRGLQQLIANEFTAIARVVGGPVVESFRTALAAVWDLLRALGPGGELQEVTATVAAAASVMADGFGEFVQRGVNAVKEFGPRITNEIFPTIRNALVWGAEFSAQFAKGIIQGAAAALTVAVKFVTSILSFFFRPQSPPRVAPDIDEWGADTFTEYLKGFTKADFGILKSLQGPIKSSLDIIKRGMELGLESGDKSGQQALVEQLTRGYTELSVAVAGAIKQARDTGVINEAVLNQVANATGRYGKEVASLLRLELELAAAMKVVAAATEQVTFAEQAQKAARDALRTVQDRMQEAREEVQRLQEELFLLHKYDIGGEITITTAEQLKVAREHLASLEGQEDAAQAVVNQATTELEVAQENLSIQREIAASISEQVDLQKEFLSQVMGLQAMQFDPFKGLEDSVKGASAAISEMMDNIAAPEIDWSQFSGNFTDIFQGIKDDMELAFQDITKPFTDAWNELTGEGGALTELGKSIDDFINLPAVQTFTNWVKENPEPIGKVAGALGLLFLLAGPAKLFGAALAAWPALGPIGAGLIILGAAWMEFGDDYMKNAPALEAQMITINEALVEMRDEVGAFETSKALWVGFFKGVVAEISPIVDNFVNTTLPDWGVRFANFWMGITGQTQYGDLKLNETGDEVEKNIITPMKDKWDTFAKKTMPLLIDDVVQGVSSLPGKLKEKADDSWAKFIEPITTGADVLLNTTIPTFVSDVVSAFAKIDLWSTGRNIIQGLWDGMKSLWASVSGWIGNAISGLINSTNKQAGVKSPSWKTEETGMYLMLGLEKGIKEYGQLAISAASSITRQINAASVLAAAPVGNTSNVVNYNVNANYQERQTPASIADDLAVLASLR